MPQPCHGPAHTVVYSWPAYTRSTKYMLNVLPFSLTALLIDIPEAWPTHTYIYGENRSLIQSLTLMHSAVKHGKL